MSSQTGSDWVKLPFMIELPGLSGWVTGLYTEPDPFNPRCVISGRRRHWGHPYGQRYRFASDRSEYFL